MTPSDQDKCGLSSLLPMSCQGQAEAFARRLHSRLRSLGSTDDDDEPADESTWLTTSENAVTSAQPHLYFDFGLESPPGSPEEDCHHSLINQLSNGAGDCTCTENSTTDLLNGHDSDQNDSESLDEPLPNPACHSNGLHGEDTDDSEEPTPRVRRCSSLKTGKTPPGTPANKKIVRFADVLGLDLADVRTFLDEIPKVPTSAYTDLVVEADESTALTFNCTQVSKVLVPLFQQPGGLPNFLDRLRESHVCLDNALVEDPVTLTVVGTVRVKNLDFHKSVHVRYTLDGWQTFADVCATYVEGSCDGFSDKFAFTLCAHTLPVGRRLEFAVRFQCRGCQYWDNNRGTNYCFQCIPSTREEAPLSLMSGDSWNNDLYY